MNKKVKIKVSILLLIFGFSGCMASNSMVDFRKKPEIKTDKFDKSVQINGIEQDFEYRSGKMLNYHFLQTFIKTNQDTMATRLYVVHHYFKDNWEFYNGAKFSDGTDADFHEVDSNVEDCSDYVDACNYNEDMMVLLPTSYLENHKDGFSVKFYSQSGSTMIIDVTKQQITAQLDNIEDVKGNIK